jgi:hypothetical protein
MRYNTDEQIVDAREHRIVSIDLRTICRRYPTIDFYMIDAKTESIVTKHVTYIRGIIIPTRTKALHRLVRSEGKGLVDELIKYSVDQPSGNLILQPFIVVD